MLERHIHFWNIRYHIRDEEYNGFQNDTEMGVGGVLGGSSNKEGMDSYKDPMRNIGIEIKKKEKKGSSKDVC